MGVSPACITFGYCMMIPAYAALWFAPRSLRADFRPNLSGFTKLAFVCVAGLAAFFVLSNIGYYFGGGYSTSLGFAEYARRVMRYFPYYLESTLLYSAAGVGISVAVFYFSGDRRLATR